MRIFSFLFILVAFVSFGFAQKTNPSISDYNVENHWDIIYKITTTDTLRLDVYLPKTEQQQQNTPVLLYVHGGSWIHGTKTMGASYYRRALKEKALNQGYAVITVEYRLLKNPDPSFPDPITDVKDAVRWVYASAEKYGFDTENIGVIGESSGAHLAMMTGYATNEMWRGDDSLKDYPSQVNYVVNNCGPTDINKLFHTGVGKVGMFFAKLVLPSHLIDLRNDLITRMTSESIDNNRKNVKQNLQYHSPLTYVEDFAIPTLSIQGTKDKIVPKKQAKLLHRAFKNSSVENETVYIKGADHVYHNLSETEIDKIIDDTMDFIKKHTK